ncbi:MAG: efflux RND transporter periplasmic adaptor subunit [Opitutaceae bacterium]|nr:efflux RND transporter periplasmic adaptor subunit [Opitutaceae bacterium]
MLHKKPSFYFAAGGILAAVLMVTHLQGDRPQPPPPIDPPAKPFEASLAASGIIESLSENVAIGVPHAGLVTEVHVQVNDRVGEGQPLFTLDRRELVAQLKVSQASLTVSTAHLQRLIDQLTRLKRVNDPRAVSEDEVRTREHDVAVAQAQVEAARAQVEQHEALLNRLTVLAPRSGTILQVNVRPGEYASATPKAAAIILGDLDHLQVRAEIDEQNAPRLKPGRPATAYLKGDTTTPITVRFVRIEPYVVPKVSLTGASTERVDTRVLQVIYAFDRTGDRPVYVGQQVDLFVDTQPEPSITTVATAATAQAGKGRL